MLRKNLILDFINTDKKVSEDISSTVKRILKNQKKSENFLNIIVNNPRDSKLAYRKIIESFKTIRDRHSFLQSYMDVYTKYMNNIFKSAEKIEDILKIIPNLSPWTLEQRFGTIKLGNVPPEFGNESQFLSLVSQINKSKVVTVFKQIKKLECHLPEFQVAFPAVKKIDWFDFSARSEFLYNLIKSKCGKPFFIKKNGVNYKISFLCNPYSNKMVFEIETSNKKKFILKTAPYRFLNIRNDRVRKEHENMAIRADSTYSDSMLEFYLKLNDCPHAPDILYYHFNHEVALYTLETGKPFHSGKNENKYLDFYSFNTQIIPDSIRLGVYINDINPGNFLLTDENIVKIIDIGHATYANPLTPGVPGMTFTFGNLCGQDYISINGVLGVEDL